MPRKSVSHETTTTVLAQRLEATRAARAQSFEVGQEVLWSQGVAPAPCRVLAKVAPDVYRVSFPAPRREFGGLSTVTLGVEALRPVRRRA